jgi:2,5-furandicarboxylate decarboxylase 1
MPWLFPGREARLLSTLRAGVPGVRRVRMPFHGAGLSTYISLVKSDDGDATRSLLLALSSDTYLKHAFVFDLDVDIFDDQAVMWALNTRFQADRDLFMVPRSKGVRMDPSGYDYLDRSARGQAVTKAGFDVTVPLERPFGPRADLPPPGFESLDPAEYLEP